MLHQFYALLILIRCQIEVSLLRQPYPGFFFHFFLVKIEGDGQVLEFLWITINHILQKLVHLLFIGSHLTNDHVLLLLLSG